MQRHQIAPAMSLLPPRAQIRPVAGISFSEAMVRATFDLALLRALMTSAAYQVAFAARVSAYRGPNRARPAVPGAQASKSGDNRVRIHQMSDTNGDGMLLSPPGDRFSAPVTVFHEKGGA